MEKLRHGRPGWHECWDELAEHFLSHLQVPRPGRWRRLSARFHRPVRLTWTRLR